MSFNKITVLGNLTHNPQLRYTSAGTPVCTLNLATNDRERNPRTKELEQRPTFFKATVWGKQAETVAQYFERGAEILLEGRLRPEEWTDRTGRPRTTLGIQVTTFNFTGGSQRHPGRISTAVSSPLPEGAQALPPVPADSLAETDDIPF